MCLMYSDGRLVCHSTMLVAGSALWRDLLPAARAEVADAGQQVTVLLPETSRAAVRIALTLLYTGRADR